jgi:hypothetical protein
VGNHNFQVRAIDGTGNPDPSPASWTWAINAPPATPAQGGVAGAGGGLAPLIKRRIQALNVPLDGAFQIATVTCRAGTCMLTDKQAVIKIAGKKYVGEISIATVTKDLAQEVTFSKGETAQVVVHFSPGVRQALAANSVGTISIKVGARTDAGGGASESKKIRLKAKWLKQLLG